LCPEAHKSRDPDKPTRTQPGEHPVSKHHRFRVDELSRIMVYVLGHRPDEFGLVPDSDGFLPVKRLLQALREEPGWSSFNEGALREVLLSEHRGDFEIDGTRIRATERRFQTHPLIPVEPPSGLLFTAVRRRAHSHALEHGLKPRPDGPHILSQDRDMALRMGRRMDASPVILEIRIPSGGQGSAPLSAFGTLFLAVEIHPEAIVGPPLSRDQQRALEQPEEPLFERKKAARGPQFDAGTFLLEAERDPDRSRRDSKGRKRRTWKETSRKIRREK